MEGHLFPAQNVALEILMQVDDICNKFGFHYTIVGRTLWGAVKYKGFLQGTAIIDIALFYPEFIKLIEKCKEEFQGTEFYILDSSNCEQYEEIYVQVAKKSRVKLPLERARDNKYYDHILLNILPIFYVGNTLKEYIQHEKKYLYLYKCMNAKKSLEDTFKITKLPMELKKAFYYRRKSPENFLKIKALFEKCSVPTRYVHIPYNTKQKGIACLAKTYENKVQYCFEGHMLFGVAKGEQWLFDHYGEKALNKQNENPTINQSVLQGPEIIRRVQLLELEMLIEVDRICRKYNIPYILTAGTLLGAVRHKGFIPWDDDIDIFMPYKQFVIFEKYAKKELDKSKYFLKTQATDLDCNLTFPQIKRNDTVFMRKGRGDFQTHPGVFIDILMLFNGSNSKLVHFLQKKICHFFKRITWAHLGAAGESRPGKRFVYELMSKVSNKTSSEMFLKFATIVKKDHNRYTYLNSIRAPFNKVFTKGDCFEHLIEVEFEGHLFWAPENYKEHLEYLYTSDYMRYPPAGQRTAKHLPALIEIGNLYEFD